MDIGKHRASARLGQRKNGYNRKKINNVTEKFHFTSMIGLHFLKDFPYYECSMFEKTVTKTGKIISQDKIYLQKLYEKSYLVYSQKKKDSVKKNLIMKEIDIDKIVSKIIKISEKLKDNSKTQTPE